MIGDRPVIARRDLLDAHDVDQEADQFVGLLGENLGALREIRFAREQFGIMLDQHAPARAARGDDVVAVLERVDRLPRQRFRAVAVAGIVGRLTTAGLTWHDDPAASVLEQFDGRKSDARPDDVDETGDEQSDARLRFRARGGRRHIHLLIDPWPKGSAALLSLGLCLLKLA